MLDKTEKIRSRGGIQKNKYPTLTSIPGRENTEKNMKTNY